MMNNDKPAKNKFIHTRNTHANLKVLQRLSVSSRLLLRTHRPRFVFLTFAHSNPRLFPFYTGQVFGVSSSDPTHLPPGGEDLQEARAPHGRLLPHRPHLHLRGVRRGHAQVPRPRLHRPRVEEEDGELETNTDVM